MVLAWNGLAVAALAEAGALLARPDLLLAAREAAQFLLEVHRVGDRWRRVSRDGVVGAPAAVLEDLADLAEGVLALHAATGEERWFTVAAELGAQVRERFTTADGLVDVADVDPALSAARAGAGSPSDPTDGATPSGTSAAAGVLLSLAALTGDGGLRDAAEQALSVCGAVAASAPRFAGWGLAVAEAFVDGPQEVAVVGAAGEAGTAALHRTALAGTAPGLVVTRGVPGRTCRDCSRTGGSSRVARRPTCAAGRSARRPRPTRSSWRSRSAPGRERSAQAEGRDEDRGDVGREAEHREGVEHLVEAEPAGAGVGPLRAVGDRPEGVREATGRDEHRDGRPAAAGEGREVADRHPAQRDVDGGVEPAGGADPEHPEGDAGSAPAHTSVSRNRARSPGRVVTASGV